MAELQQTSLVLVAEEGIYYPRMYRHYNDLQIKSIKPSATTDQLIKDQYKDQEEDLNDQSISEDLHSPKKKTVEKTETAKPVPAELQRAMEQRAWLERNRKKPCGPESPDSASEVAALASSALASPLERLNKSLRMACGRFFEKKG